MQFRMDYLNTNNYHLEIEWKKYTARHPTTRFSMVNLHTKIIAIIKIFNVMGNGMTWCIHSHSRSRSHSHKMQGTAHREHQCRASESASVTASASASTNANPNEPNQPNEPSVGKCYLFFHLFHYGCLSTLYTSQSFNTTTTTGRPSDRPNQTIHDVGPTS